MADDRYRGAYDAAVEDVDSFLIQLAEKKRFANLIAEKAGMDPPYGDVETPVVGKVATVIRADQFVNFPSPSAAARAFLEWRGQGKGSTSLDVIYDGLVDGGFAFTSTKNDPKGGLKVALGKDALVLRLSNGTYGLRQWYPNVRRPTGKKGDQREDDEAPDSGGDSGEDLDNSEAEVSSPAGTGGEEKAAEQG